MLFDSCEEKLTIRSPTTITSARTLIFPVASIHRMIHMMTARSTTGPSLGHIKNVASHRQPFYKTVRLISDFHLKHYIQSSKIPAHINIFSPKPPRKGRSNSNLVYKNFISRTKQGISPGKGNRVKAVKSDILTMARQMREDECDGLCPMRMLHEDNEPKSLNCYRCGKLTTTRCTGCKRVLCYDRDRSSNEDPGNVYHEWQTLKFRRSCFQIAHEKRWEEIWSKRRCEPTTLDRLVKRQRTNDTE